MKALALGFALTLAAPFLVVSSADAGAVLPEAASEQQVAFDAGVIAPCCPENCVCVVRDNSCIPVVCF